MSKACATFLDDYGESIVENRLSGNLMLHMINLYDFGLIKPDLVYRIMMRVYRLRDKLEADGRLNGPPTAPLASAVPTQGPSSSSTLTVPNSVQNVVKQEPLCDCDKLGIKQEPDPEPS